MKGQRRKGTDREEETERIDRVEIHRKRVGGKEINYNRKNHRVQKVKGHQTSRSVEA
jgi:hypothetical protein